MVDNLLLGDTTDGLVGRCQGGRYSSGSDAGSSIGSGIGETTSKAIKVGRAIGSVKAIGLVMNVP